MSDENWITERLIIKPSCENDHEECAKLLIDKEVYSQLSKVPISLKTIEAAKKFVSTVNDNYTIRMKDSNEIIGQFGFPIVKDAFEIFYWIGKKYQRKGFASEALLEFTDYYFEKSNIDKIIFEYFPDNEASSKLAYKIVEYLLKKHSDWIIIDKKENILNYTVNMVTDDQIYLYIDESKEVLSENVTSISGEIFPRDLFPDELAIVGTKIKVVTKFYIISKNKTINNELK